MPTWQFSTLPRRPHHWRATPQEALPFLGKPRPSSTITASGASAAAADVGGGHLGISEQGLGLGALQQRGTRHSCLSQTSLVRANDGRLVYPPRRNRYSRNRA